MAEYVNQRILTLAGVMLLAVTAISMSAATLDSATGPPQVVGGDSPPADIEGNGDSSQGDPPDGSDVLSGGGPTEGTSISLSGCISFLASAPGTLLFFGGIAGFFILLKRRFPLGIVLLTGYVVTPVALAFYFLQTKCTTIGPGNGGGGGDGGAGILTSTPTSFDLPPSLLLGLFTVLFVGVAVAIYFTSGTPEYETQEEDDSPEQEADVRDIAAAAADAAERLKERDADADNEVYRAWWEMTQLLNVSSPETYTPGEFAEAAIELGIDEEYVDSMTTLFNEVRYGHADPETREERALEVFEAIEDEYGGDRPRSGESTTDSTMEDEQ